MSPAAKAKSNGELSLPSFRDGAHFKVRPLNFGGFKVVGRAEAAALPPVDVMSVMIIETLKRDFSDVTEKEVDEMEMDDTMKLTDMVTKANEGLKDAPDQHGQLAAALAYHYHYRLDYIDTLDLDEVKMLIDYVMPKTQKTAKGSPMRDAKNDRLTRALSKMQKARDEGHT